MSYHPSLLTPKTILKIQTAQRSEQLTPEQHQIAKLTADLYRAATVCKSAEAQEQLRLIFAITAEAQDAYFEAVQS